jgi:ubiquinone/menaquinone biosynthesis C-methylase UbiE/uncharacterized protein YbaR (Trm112 family)
MIGTDDIEFCCPVCRQVVERTAVAFGCDACGRRYPIVLGIPDFRVEPDPWIDLDEDRSKAQRLEEVSAGQDFSMTVKLYWDMTPTTPQRFALRFREHVESATVRTREWLQPFVAIVGTTRSPWLDIGCGTADLAAAAPPEQRVVGIDVAMRWLVVARKRLQEAGRPVDLVCCNAEHLPFPADYFGHVLSLGTLEHVRDASATLSEARRVLQRGGRLCLRTVNRFTMLSEPHVDLWGVGWIPRRYADAYVRWRNGQRYLHHRPLSRRELAREVRRAGFGDVQVRPSRLLQADQARLGMLAPAAAVYELARHLPLLGHGLSWVAPMLDVEGVAA